MRGALNYFLLRDIFAANFFFSLKNIKTIMVRHAEYSMLVSYNGIHVYFFSLARDLVFEYEKL